MSSSTRVQDRPAGVRPRRRAVGLGGLLGILTATLGPWLAVSATAAEEAPARTGIETIPATGVDGAGGLLAAGALLVLAGGLAILARRRTGPHPD